MKSMIITLIVILVAVLLAFNFFSNSTRDMDKSMNISPAEFKEKVKTESGVVIDVRTDDEYNNGHLAIADHQFNLLDGEFESKLDSLNKNKTYYLYCRSGNRSGQAARLMKKNGFKNVYNAGGFGNLAAEGFETK